MLSHLNICILHAHSGDDKCQDIIFDIILNIGWFVQSESVVYVVGCRNRQLFLETIESTSHHQHILSLVFVK